MHWDCQFDIIDTVVFRFLRELLTLLPIESLGYQFQEGIKHMQQLSYFSFLVDTQMLLHILQGVKASMYAKRGLNLLLLSH
jgi:hypothetical protein